MSTNDHFQEQSCENNTMEEPSAVEEKTIFKDAAEASTIATDLVNDEAAESTTPVELKPYTPYIKFDDVNDANKFSVVIFVDLTAEKEERLLQQENRLDSNSLESIVDKKFKLHAYLFFVFDFNKKYKKISKICFFCF